MSTASRESSASVLITRSATLASQGRVDEAIACCREAAAQLPHRADVYRNLLYMLWFSPTESRESIIAEHLRWGQRFGAVDDGSPHENDPNPTRRLCIGYVSPDLCGHVVGLFMRSIMREHDPASVEAFCYFNGKSDSVADEIRGFSHHWTDTREMDDKRLARRIRRDRIDILVDLSLHMANNRLAVFAYKPAPVQVTYLGYPGTSGLAQMDYRLTDARLEPAERGDGWLGPERLERLDSYWCYAVPTDAPPVSSLAQSRNGYITFGCTNNFGKVSPQLIGLWCQILQSIPGSKLQFTIRGGIAPPHLLDSFAIAGIDRSRLTVLDYLPFTDYLKSYHNIDVSLDTFPYNGGTTTFDSLLMGVPVVTLAGELPVSRMGLTILEMLGLGGFIAQTPDQYVSKAVGLAQSLAPHTDLPSKTRARLLQSKLVDAVRFTRDLEGAYRRMWGRWCES
jgi:protein O-GlcNAc transferase